MFLVKYLTIFVNFKYKIFEQLYVKVIFWSYQVCIEIYCKTDLLNAIKTWDTEYKVCAENQSKNKPWISQNWFHLKNSLQNKLDINLSWRSNCRTQFQVLSRNTWECLRKFSEASLFIHKSSCINKLCNTHFLRDQNKLEKFVRCSQASINSLKINANF